MAQTTRVPPFTREAINLPVAPEAPGWFHDHVRTVRDLITRVQQDVDTLAGRRGHSTFFADPVFTKGIDITVPSGASFNLVLPAQQIGDLLTADTTTSFTRLADVAAGSYLRSGGVNVTPLWSTLTLPNAATTGDVLIATGTNAIDRLADVAVGSYLRSGGVSTAPLWSTLTLPNAVTQGDLLIATAANVMGNLADVATGSVLISGGVGVVPSWSAIPTLTGVNLGNQTLSTYIEATFTATGTGFAVNPTGTARYVQVGKTVTLFLPQLTGTSNAPTFTVTGLPVAIQPTQTSHTVARVTDNGVDAFGVVRLNAGTTTLDVLANAAGTNWTSAGTKTLYALVVSYTLN